MRGKARLELVKRNTQQRFVVGKVVLDKRPLLQHRLDVIVGGRHIIYQVFFTGADLKLIDSYRNLSSLQCDQR